MSDFEQEREEFFRHFPVSHETRAKLDRYAELLREWNAKFNLVSENSFLHLWRRHFLDSAQLLKFFPKEKIIAADLGSGAGFPGIVLSILGVGKIHLVESIGKKANFLLAVIEDLKLDAQVEHKRIEDCRLKADIVTARALKPLPELLALAKPLMKKDSFCILLKGQHLDDELTESTKYWRFESKTFPSLSDSSGRVLIIRKLDRQAKSHAAIRHRR
ncbi:MAG TPA: 16S rRNA (guanine(527)-N(7))-methyltransferase RsmG [Alphaproteobacteria bacterium]|nr:16S rRNA (guanine(527)-N(7))-methyltransferase RsmG [Alphaproteobacteria bacterium]